MVSSVLLLLLVHSNPWLAPFERHLSYVRDLKPYVSIGTGLQYNVPMPIVIRQTGQPDLRLTARFSTRPFFEVPYYGVKVGVTRKLWAGELELVHHKLYLDNRPPEVDTFEITHGYNPILLNVVRGRVVSRSARARESSWRIRSQPSAGCGFPKPAASWDGTFAGQRRSSASVSGLTSTASSLPGSRARSSAPGPAFRLSKAAPMCRTCHCTVW